MRDTGVESVEQLYADVPAKYRLKERLSLPAEGLSEYEVKRHVETVLSKNTTTDEMPVFLGAGCWPHYVPALVKEIVQRSELLTSYTPYQPEISQGMLQALFEYQSMVCALTGMDVANCSTYDLGFRAGGSGKDGRTDKVSRGNPYAEDHPPGERGDVESLR